MMSLSVAKRIQRAAQPTKPIPGWRTMTGAQRRNAQYDRIWEAAKNEPTRFNESSRIESPAAPVIPAFRELAYDYTNQAWIVNGVYQSCGHPKPCTCFGTVHAGEKPQVGADIH